MFNSKFKIQNSKFGFTMIELLIVIAVLGVLAVAVLSAINPIEQINRGRDTGSRSDAEQLLSAIDRYYTTQEVYPWQRKEEDDPEDVAWQEVVSTWADPGGASVLDKLSTGGTAELKQSFITRITNLPAANRLYLHKSDLVGSSVYVCFTSRSGSFDTEARTRCGTDCAGLPADLLDAGCDSICPAAPAKAVICLP